LDALVHWLVSGGWLLSALAGAALAEIAAPRRSLTAARTLRWPTNAGLGVINVALLAAFAAWLTSGAATSRWGLLPLLGLPLALTVVVSVIVLDAASYAAHRALHRVPGLWVVHRVHHADCDCDATTALRFHPGEALLSGAVQATVIAILGVPPAGVLAHYALAQTLTVLEHANVRIPAVVERPLRRVFVTPDMHRIHHSAQPGEGDTNFATILPLWDRLFGTYRAEPAGGHETMRVGLEQFRTAKDLTLPWTLLLPFRR
jgi:sterol desaturase/sphingolipid hydroxylase (fatty acid hydroxylase superfamily)